jgi:gluconokinase
MKNFAVRSPGAKVGGLVYFGRMLDKIRVNAKGELPEEYQSNLGERFDRKCVDLLQIDYGNLVERVKEGGTDEEILEWCFARGQKPAENEIHVWNEFMRKRGWNDELSETLTRRKKEAGMAGRSEIRTMFDFIDADEGRFAKGDM